MWMSLLLEGFVSNREQSYEDPIEELLYAVFVVSSENSTVAELAATLQADLSQLQAAASFACRLGWAVKLIDPASILQEPNVPGSPKSLLSDEEDGSHASLGSANVSADGSAFQQVEIPWTENNSRSSGYARVAFLVDANITSYLMMGSVSPGLKSHAVTLYEAGKLGHASIADLCKDLGTLEGAKFEGELQEFANHAFSLRCILECLTTVIRGLVEAVSAPNLSDFYPVLGKLDLQGLRKRARYVMTEIRSNWELILEERRKNKESGSSGQHDFLEALLDNGLTNDCIHQLFVELVSAGSDTSTSTIEWAMAELIKNVESMKKVQEELEIEFSESDYPKESQLLQMSYVQACVKETLRLHPPAPFLLPHRAIETCQVMNLTIPKDAQILVNIWAITRDPLIWEDPEMFRPQRFLSSDMDFKGNDFEFLPFGAGRRICPGLPMAAIIIPLVLASLVHFFDWELPHRERPTELDMTEKFGVTLQKKEPLLLIPKPRK